MYKNVIKTFEILRSEITFVMDLYTLVTVLWCSLCFQGIPFKEHISMQYHLSTDEQQAEQGL